jgi:proteasome lid subunit RPN8/RPN11
VTAVRVPAPLIREMSQHARTTYPDECCGYLIARPDLPADGLRTIETIEPAANRFEGERRRRFVIVPEELRAVEERLARQGLAVVGFYHSHPDHPARPSAFDAEHAWPWYTYLVLATTATEVAAIGAFELDPETGRFAEVPFQPTPPAASEMAGA